MTTELSARIENLPDSTFKTREILGYRNQEIADLPDQDLPVVKDLWEILGVLITKFENQEFILQGGNGKLLTNLSEAIERVKEGNINGAEQLLLEMKNNLLQNK